MNTFLPYASFEASALCLDDQRLGKQRLEARQLLDALLGRSEAWLNHPCTKMWRGHARWLAEYGAAMCREWRRRGFKDEMLGEFERLAKTLPQSEEPQFTEELHSSMRANLVRKDPERYAKFLGFVEEPQDSYAWPKEGS